MVDAPRYNWVFKELVKDRDDVTGALAYVLYKQDKVAYIEQLVKERDGQQPTSDDLASFRRHTSLTPVLSGYRDRADVLLEEFLDNALKATLAAYQASIKDDAIVKAVATSFWTGVQQNVVAGRVTTLLTFGAVLIFWMTEVGPSKIVEGALRRVFTSEIATSASDQAIRPTEKAGN